MIPLLTWYHKNCICFPRLFFPQCWLHSQIESSCLIVMEKVANSYSRLLTEQLCKLKFTIVSGEIWEYIFHLLAWVSHLLLILGVGIILPWNIGPKSILKMTNLFHRRKDEFRCSLTLDGRHCFYLSNSYFPWFPPLPQDPRADGKLTLPALRV